MTPDEVSPSGWTLDAFREAVQRQFLDRDKAVQTALTAQEKAVNAALAAAEKAVAKAETAAEKRFDSVNEFRAQLSDQAALFIPRIEAENRIAQNTEKIEAVTVRINDLDKRIGSRLDLAQGRSAGVAATYAAAAAAGAVISGVIGVVINFAR